MITSNDLDEIIVINDVPVKIRDIQNQDDKAFMGYGHFAWDINKRERHLGIGTYEPAECMRANESSGTWINYGQNLVCPGCGLDFT